MEAYVTIWVKESGGFYWKPVQTVRLIDAEEEIRQLKSGQWAHAEFRFLAVGLVPEREVK